MRHTKNSLDRVGKGMHSRTLANDCPANIASNHIAWCATGFWPSSQAVTMPGESKHCAWRASMSDGGFLSSLVVQASIACTVASISVVAATRIARSTYSWDATTPISAVASAVTIEMERDFGSGSGRRWNLHQREPCTLGVADAVDGPQLLLAAR